MNRTEFKILDILSREIGIPVSIRELTSEVKERYGSAHYANIYNSTKSLQDESIIQIEKQGKASIPFLNFANFLLTDVLVEMELQKKREFIDRWPEGQLLFEGIDDSFSNLLFVRSIILIDWTRNMKLNRAELLIMLDAEAANKRTTANELASDLRKNYPIRTEYLVITESELLDFIKSSEQNPIKEMLSDKIALHLPQNFWKLVRNAYQRGVRIRFDTQQTDPLKVSDIDLAYNLARFGYKELGQEIRLGEDLSIEHVVASIILKEDKRRIAAVPMILAKNRANYSLLVFLSQRHGFAEKLLGLLTTLNKLVPAEELGQAITLLKEAGTRVIRQDEAQVRTVMKLYGVGAR